MDTTKFVEAIGKSDLPFVHSGNKLQDEKCQKALKKISSEGTVLGVMTDSLDRGLVVTEKGIWSSPYLIDVKGAKSNDAFPFDSFVLHNVAISPESIIEFTMWDKEKSKIFTGKFRLMQDTSFKDAMKEGMTGVAAAKDRELEDIFKTLVSKTGTEYVHIRLDADGKLIPAEKVPNIFDFMWNDIHTRINIENDSVVISKFKVDEKTTIQTPIESPATIPRAAIESIRTQKDFSPITFMKYMGMGIGTLIVFGFIFFPIGIIAFLVFAGFGLSFAFPMSLIIKRKDGQKFSTRFYGSAKGDPEYERFIKAIF